MLPPVIIICVYLDPVVFLSHHSGAELANLDSQPAVDWDEKNTECHASQKGQSNLNTPAYSMHVH